MTPADAASIRPRHLRLVRPPEGSVASLEPRRRANATGVRAAAASRRTVTLLLGSTVFLVLAGLVMVLSASSVSAFAEFGDSFVFVQRQAAYAVVGTAALLLTSRMRPEVWRRLAWPLLLVTLGMLALVLVPHTGVEAYGSTRWFQLGPVTVQPSELAKLSVVVFGAAMISKKWDRIDDLGQLAIPLLPVCAGVCAMVMLQPDLGTTVIIAGSVFLLLFVAGVRLRYLTLAGMVAAVLGTGLIWSADYRRIRFLSFLHPWEDAKNSGYQLIQSLIALGSGGLTGVGLGASRQKWQYVPNAHNDFVFSILGEELGLIGEILVVAAFAMLIFAGVKIATRTTDVFSRLLAAGVVGWLGLQALVNLGAVTGLLPITGVPLPFLSYGGSSLVVSLAAVGVLVSIARTTSRAGDGHGPVQRGRSRAA